MAYPRLVFTLFAVLASSCAYEAFGGSVTCGDEGAVDGERRCENGVWVTGPSDAGPDRNNGSDAGGDASPDNGTTCTPDDDATICAAAMAACGELTTTDNCDDERTVSCGNCEAPETCGGGGTANVCGCTPETDADLCEANTLDCGDVTLTDQCGTERSINCGECTDPATCGGGGTANVCGCPTESDADFCRVNNAECGVVTEVDSCGQMRTVDCETCGGCMTCPEGETCAAQGTANQCECTPESDAVFCSRQGKNCGAFTGTDNCGNERTNVLCGTCDLPATCGGGGDNNVCGCNPSTDLTDICVGLGLVCGTQDASSVCPGFGDVDCGNRACQGSNLRCDGSECICGFSDCGSNDCFDGLRCSTSNPDRVCHQGDCCDPVGDSTLCSDNNLSCGTATVMDNCGQMRQIDCGSCNDGTCMNNMCICDAANDCPEFGCEVYGPGDCDNDIDCGACGAAQTCNDNECRCDDCTNSACEVGQDCGNGDSCQSDGQCD